MGGALCKAEVEEEKRSEGREESLTSVDRIRRITVKQFGYNVLSLARRGLKVWTPKYYLPRLSLSLYPRSPHPPSSSSSSGGSS